MVHEVVSQYAAKVQQVAFEFLGYLVVANW